MDGNMLNGRSDNATVVSGANILLESGKGRIGASDKRFIVDVDNGSTLSGRSRDGIYIGEATGDVNVGSFYSKAVIDLLSPGGIYDNALDTITDIKGQDVTLTAENSIGQEPADGDSSQVKKNKALDIATINDDNSTFTVTSNTDGAWLYTDFGQSMRLTGADLNGDLDMAVASGLKVVGSLDTNGGTVTLRSFESLNLEGIGGVDTNGAVLNLSSGDNMQLSGSISTGGGDIMATVGDNFTTAENTSLSTSGGDLEIQADALADSLGYQNVTIGDGSVINLDNGTLLIESSDTVTLTGVVTTNNTDDAVVVRATSIQDGGDSNADITMNGNGNITLKTHSYANLNRIDYNGSEALTISVNGKNDGARAVATMLGIEAEAGINVTNLSVNSGAIQSPIDSVFNVINGRIRDSLFVTVGGFDARVGRLPDNMLEPDRWLSAGASPGFFENGALSSGVREEDYRCTGLPSFITDANAVLDFTFTYDNPVVNCTGVLTYYRLPYVLSAPVETSEQVLDSQLAGLVSSSLINLRTINSEDLIDQSSLILETPNVAREAVKSERKQTEAIQQAQAASDDFIGSFRTRSQGLFGAINIDGDGFIVPVAIDQNQDQPEQEEDQAQEETTPPLANNDNNDNEADSDIGPLSLLNN